MICAASLFSQEVSDSTFLLEEVKITGKRIVTNTAGLKVLKQDSMTLANHSSSNLGQLISSQTTSFVKNYGPSGISTISFRGKSAVHSALIWEGFNINPNNLGIADISILPVFAFDDISVQYGGASSLFGSGLIGGGIHLSSDPGFDKGFRLREQISLGSFGFLNNNISLDYSNSRLSARAMMIHHTSSNEFEYDKGKHRIKQSNAAVRSNSLLSQLAFKPGAKNLIKANFWISDTYREIPPSLTMSFSDARQEDKFARTGLLWKSTFNEAVFISRFAYFYDYQHYVDPHEDPAAEIDSEIILHSLLFETEYKKNLFEDIYMNSGISLAGYIADIEAYEDNRSRKQAAVFLSIVKNIRTLKWKTSVNARQEIVEGLSNPFSASVGAEGKIWGVLSGRFNISKNFRLPTMNDLYWVPGGNKDLKPESSLNEEAGLGIELKKSEFWGLEADVTFYNSHVQNWIIWLPLTGSSLWSPENIQTVWSRGIEASSKFSVHLNKFRLQLKPSLALTKSTFDEDPAGSADVKGNQLIYTPFLTYLIQCNILYKRVSLSFSHSYTGIRYITSDNKDELPPYWLDDIILSYLHKTGKHSFNIRLGVNNIFNKQYEVVLYRPMPGRSANISISYLLN